jgi:hypothetical protein
MSIDNIVAIVGVTILIPSSVRKKCNSDQCGSCELGLSIYR